MTLLPWGAESHAFQNQPENAGGKVAEPPHPRTGVGSTLVFFYCVCQASVVNLLMENLDASSQRKAAWWPMKPKKLHKQNIIVLIINV